MKSAQIRDGSAEQQSSSKQANAKLRPNATRMKRQNEETSAINDVQQSKRVKRNLQQGNNRGSPMMLVKLYQDMTDYQRQLVDSAGFGGLLNCGCSQIFPELCQWLLDCYDPESSELVFPGRGSIPITEATIHRVMGIPMGAEIIKCELNAAASSFMLGGFGVSKGNHPKISHLLNLLKENRNADQKYLRTWTLFAACSVITPTFSTKVSPRLYPAVMDATSIWKKNWCELVLRVFKQSRQAEPKKHSFKPCLTLLMILYIDSLQTGFKRISARGCRVTVWTTNLIRKAIAKDTKPDGTFGALQLKPEFAGQDNLFFGNPLHLHSFINNHVPESFGPQERLKAKRAVQEMCTGFSKLVSKFLQGFYQPDTSTHDEVTNHEGADNGGVFDDEGSEEEDGKGNDSDKDEENQSTDPQWHCKTESEAEDNLSLVYSEHINRWANLRRQSMLGQNLSPPVDVSPSGNDYSHDPESSDTNKAREKIQQLDVELAKNSEHASDSEMDTPLSTPCKSPKSSHSGSRLSEKNSLQVTSHGLVSLVPMNGHICASPGHSTPQNESIPNSAGKQWTVKKSYLR